MTDALNFLKSMISVAGLSGHESPIARLVQEEWSPLVDELTRSHLGSLHGLKKGALPLDRFRKERPSVMIAAHMDAIGLMVTRIVDGFLYITGIGDVDPRVLPGTPVIVHASSGDELFGVVVMPPAALLPEGEGSKAIGIKYLFVDTGLASREVSKRVSVGDLISFNTEAVEIAGGCVSGHSIDNRASIAALTVCLQELRSKSHLWDVWAVAPVQEEVTFAGAYTSTYQIRPTIAVAVDVTFGKGFSEIIDEENKWNTHSMGKGITLGMGPVVHPYLFKRFQEVAERTEIPFSPEPMAENSNTDADAIQLTRDGVPTMVLSIPMRYMHTPVEMISIKDIQRAGRLLAEFIVSLEADFIEKMEWE